MTDTDLLAASRPIYVGEYDADSTAPLTIPDGYRTARLLVKRGGQPVGLVLLPVTDGRFKPEALTRAVAGLSAVHDAAMLAARQDASTMGSRRTAENDAALPSVTVTIATHNRPEALRRALTTVLSNDAGDEILVVDNAPSDGAAREVVGELAASDERLRYVLEPRQGLSKARNRAIAEARGDVLLFTDDDVEVDREWIPGHRRVYADPSVDCVTGPAYAARLDSVEEVLCEAGVGWSKGFEQQRYELHRPPAGAGLFPFSPGLFGGGMNFSVRLRLARALGGFDEALGAGTSTKGAEDCDFFVRLVRGGHVLVYTPDAYMYHHHRGDARAYEDQRDGYSLGLGAYMGKLTSDPRNWPAILTRVPAVVRQQRRAKLPVTADAPAAPRFRNEALMVTGAALYQRERLTRLVRH